jgi:hypothetical protein
MKGNSYPNAGWASDKLFYDYLLTWLVLAGGYFLLREEQQQLNKRNGVF